MMQVVHILQKQKRAENRALRNAVQDVKARGVVNPDLRKLLNMFKGICIPLECDPSNAVS